MGSRYIPDIQVPPPAAGVGMRAGAGAFGAISAALERYQALKQQELMNQRLLSNDAWNKQYQQGELAQGQQRIGLEGQRLADTQQTGDERVASEFINNYGGRSFDPSTSQGADVIKMLTAGKQGGALTPETIPLGNTPYVTSPGAAQGGVGDRQTEEPLYFTPTETGRQTIVPTDPWHLRANTATNARIAANGEANRGVAMQRIISQEAMHAFTQTHMTDFQRASLALRQRGQDISAAQLQMMFERNGANQTQEQFMNSLREFQARAHDPAAVMQMFQPGYQAPTLPALPYFPDLTPPRIPGAGSDFSGTPIR